MAFPLLATERRLQQQGRRRGFKNQGVEEGEKKGGGEKEETGEGRIWSHHLTPEIALDPGAHLHTTTATLLDTRPHCAPAKISPTIRGFSLECHACLLIISMCTLKVRRRIPFKRVPCNIFLTFTRFQYSAPIFRESLVTFLFLLCT